jgi:phytoene dehydrogenase-like protein
LKDKYSTIVIGAGVGGLTTAAYLAKNGLKPLVLEKTKWPGGRCYARTIDGIEFDIGALYIGEKASKILEQDLGLHIETEFYRIGIKIGKHLFSIPFGLRTLGELIRGGVSWTDILWLVMKISKLFKPKFFDSYKSVGEVIDSLTRNDIIRKIGYVLFGASGVSPYSLPSRYLRIDKDAPGTDVGNPIHFLGGNRIIADQLVSTIGEWGGEIHFEENVERILFENGRASGVVTKGAHYSADYVVSNADIHSSIVELSPPEIFKGNNYLEKVSLIEKPLSLVCIFLTFVLSAEFPRSFGAFFVPSASPIDEFEMLQSGRFPEQSTFCLYVPTNIERRTEAVHRATIQFYYPRGLVSSDALNQQVEEILTPGLERLFAGLSSKVLNYTVYDPQRYEQSFGFKPVVFGASPNLVYTRLPQQTPISNFFCVGDSVQPDRPSVPQAMESGLTCARMIVDGLQTTNH